LAMACSFHASVAQSLGARSIMLETGCALVATVDWCVVVALGHP